MSIGLIFLVYLQGFDGNLKRGKCEDLKLPYKTTLDSLQGKWKWVLDTEYTCVIAGNIFNDKYMASDLSYSYDNKFRIFFSDTSVDARRDYTINQVQIDTLKTSGNYMVLVSLADSSIDCYRFGGILYNNNDTTFIITDVFAKRKTCVFKKIR